MVDLRVVDLKSKKIKDFSKYLSYILRHNPDDIGITLDTQGYVSVDILLSALNKCSKYCLDLKVLQSIVELDEKQRYSFKDGYKFIRANQGHSVDCVCIDFKKYTPKGNLYHGTSVRNAELIFKQGKILPMSRQYVHLSKDMETGTKVGTRHGAVKVLEIDAVGMQQAGYDFFISDNNVILTKEVPIKYVKQM